MRRPKTGEIRSYTARREPMQATVIPDPPPQQQEVRGLHLVPCFTCQQPISFKKNPTWSGWNRKWLLFNEDGSAHYCQHPASGPVRIRRQT